MILSLCFVVISTLCVAMISIMCVAMISTLYVAMMPHSAVGNVSGYRCVSDCISRGREFDPGPVPYFRGD